MPTPNSHDYGAYPSGHDGGYYPSHDNDYPTQGYPTQSYPEYKESLKQNRVFASQKPTEPPKERKSGKFGWPAIIAAVLLLLVGSGITLTSLDLGSDSDSDTFTPTSSNNEEALEYAQKQLEYTHYSYAKLEERLSDDFEPRFSDGAVQYAMDNVDADWNAEAVEALESYVRHGHLSELGMMRQLTSPSGEAFPQDQAEHALDTVDVDWNEEAVEAAESYRSLHNVNTAEKLHDTLTSENVAGFTEEQADYGMRQIGVS